MSAFLGGDQLVMEGQAPGKDSLEVRRFGGLVRRAALLTICLLFLGKLYLIVTLNINWDEFFYLSHVYQAEQGLLGQAWQTFHVQFFGWLVEWGGNEADQILAARTVMAVIGALTACLIFALARDFFGTTAALCALLLYSAYAQVVVHGFSFRADPICAFLLLLSFYLLLRSDKGPALLLFLAALPMAMAALFSVKSGLFVPAFALVFLYEYRQGQKIRAVVRAGTFGLCVLCAMGLFYLYHKSQLASAGGANTAVEQTTAFLQASGRKTIFEAAFLPRLPSFLNTLVQNAITWVVLLLSFLGLLFSLGMRKPMGGHRRAVIALAWFTPVLSVLFYRNAFPYFYVLLLPAGCLALAAGFHWLLGRSAVPGVYRTLLIAILAATAASGGVKILQHRANEQQSQRQHIEAVHRMFPAPVAYIDRNAMIASFPKVGFFMSTWGIEGYRQNNIAVMRDLLDRHQPKLLIANTPVLAIDDPDWFGQENSVYRLLDDDYLILSDNFVHHWGRIFVPGKQFKAYHLKAGELEFEILIEGPYQLEAAGPMRIDDQLFQPGAVVELTAGPHSIVPVDQDEPGPAVLRWGRDLYRPGTPAPAQRIYTGF